MKKKILSLLLCFTLVVGILPIIAMAGEVTAYPTAVAIYNSKGDCITLSDGNYLTTTDSSIIQTNWSAGTSYAARYDATNGTLYLNGYTSQFAHGSGIMPINGNIFNLYLTGVNTIQGNNVGFQGSVYGIYSSGALNISGDGKMKVTCTTSKTGVYGIYSSGEISVSTPIDVFTKTEESGYVAYGLYAYGKITLYGGEKTVTVQSSTSNNNGTYGIYVNAGEVNISGKLAVQLDSKGTAIYAKNNSAATMPSITLNGGEVNVVGNARYGLYEDSLAKTSEVGIEIKNSSRLTMTEATGVENSIFSQNNGLMIDSSTVDVKADSSSAVAVGKAVSIVNSDVSITTDSISAEAVVTGGEAENSINLSPKGTVVVKTKNTESHYPISGKVTIVEGTVCTKGTTYDSEKKNYYNCTRDSKGYSFVEFKGTPFATMGDMTVAGTVNEALSGTDVTITLTNDTFNVIVAETDVKSWFINMPKGLEAKIKHNVGAEETQATITINGTPTEASSEAMAITIPADLLVTSNNDLMVTNNANAKFSIEKAMPIYNVPTGLTAIYGQNLSEITLTNPDNNTGGTWVWVDGTQRVGNVGNNKFKAKFRPNDTDIYKTPTEAVDVSVTVSARDISNVNVATIVDQNYNGSALTPDITVTDSTLGNEPLTKDMDYAVVYMDNTNAGTATVTLAGKGNYNGTKNVTFSINKADRVAPINLGVMAPSASGGNGKIIATTTEMEYSTDSSFASPAGTACTAGDTEVASGTYYVRYKADANHNASSVATVTVPTYSATKYTVTVINDNNGMAGASMTFDITPGEIIKLTVTPSVGYVFDKWENITPYDLIITDNTFTMPSNDVSVRACFKPATLTGTAEITGTMKAGHELTATLIGGNNTGELQYTWYQNGTTQILSNNTGKYMLKEDDIGKTITVKINSDIQTGKITSSATSVVKKAAAPTAPSAFTLTFTLNSDEYTFTATIPAIEGAEYSFDGMNYSDVNTKDDCIPNTEYTGHVRIKETATQEASAATSDAQTAPKLTVATPVFTPNGISKFSNTLSIEITCATTGAKIYYTTDGTVPTANSAEYTDPLSLTTTTTVRAIAIRADMNDSVIVSETFTKSYESKSGGGSSGGGGSVVVPDRGKSEMVTNPDGSTTKSENKTETKSDGTKVETTTNQTTKTDGTKTEVTSEVTTAKDGTTTKTETAKTTDASGSTGTTTTVTDATGATTVTADATVSAKAVETAQNSDKAVTIPVEVKATSDTKTAATVNINIEVKSSGQSDKAATVKIEVPVTNVDSGTVAVLVKADGTEEIIKTTVPTENGVAISVDGNVTIKVVDNSKTFEDTTSHWSKDEVNFVASREIFNGVGGGHFGVSEPMTRGMVNTVLARLAGEDTNGGENWYDKGNEWAVKNGVSDGTNPTDSVTREQLATMLYRYAGSPEVSGDINFADSSAISEYAQKALLWATQNGIINGMGDGTIAPSAEAERAQVAAMMARFLKNL